MVILNLQPEKLENELIELRPLSGKDFDRLFEVSSDPLIWEQHPIKDRYKREVFQMFFDSAIASKSSFLIFDKTTGELMGSTRFYDFQPELSKLAIGYTFLARKFWGGQYNKPLKELMLDYAFQFVDTVVFHIGITNFRSQKAILKIGAKKTHEIVLNINGKRYPHFEYEIQKHEWKMY
jgi:RimJ/RimL family protein N-acetyltransferase